MPDVGCGQSPKPASRRRPAASGWFPFGGPGGPGHFHISIRNSRVSQDLYFKYGVGNIPDHPDRLGWDDCYKPEKINVHIRRSPSTSSSWERFSALSTGARCVAALVVTTKPWNVLKRMNRGYRHLYVGFMPTEVNEFNTERLTSRSPHNQTTVLRTWSPKRVRAFSRSWTMPRAGSTTAWNT